MAGNFLATPKVCKECGKRHLREDECEMADKQNTVLCPCVKGEPCSIHPKQDEELRLTDIEIESALVGRHTRDEGHHLVADAQLAKAHPILLAEGAGKERERIFADIKMHTVSIRPNKSAPGWIKIHLTYAKEYWQALKAEK